MEIIAQMTVPETAGSSRLREFVQAYFKKFYPSGKSAKTAIEKGLFLVNNEAGNTGTIVRPGDIIALCLEDPKPGVIYPFAMTVVYEDIHYAIIDKPAGISVHNNARRSVINALPFNLQLSTEPDALIRPQPVHRLDALTSGLLMIAKTRRFQMAAGQLFEQGSIRKKYIAVVIGLIMESCLIDFPVAGQESESYIVPLKNMSHPQFGHLTVLSLFPRTGRMHQLRIHCAMLGHPILGERLYAPEIPNLSGKGLFLAAVGLEFVHPLTGEEMRFEIDPPAKIRKYLFV